MLLQGFFVNLYTFKMFCIVTATFVLQIYVYSLGCYLCNKSIHNCVYLNHSELTAMLINYAAGLYWIFIMCSEPRHSWVKHSELVG